MTGIPEAGWLFTRGSESVRLVREEDSEGCRLFLHGPGTEVMVHEFADLTECMKRQAEIERNLLAAGYQLAQSSSDRRSEPRDTARTRSSSGGELNLVAEHPTSDALFWSRRGQVACGPHAPDPRSDCWRAEGWCPIPEAESRRHGLAYQCPRCAPDGRPHRHVSGARDANDIVRSL